MKRLFLALIPLLSLGVTAQAQNSSGLLMNRDILPASTILSLSQREVAGTARSMGMGGAFASLGADMASLSYNPAGVGMYQRNEVSMSFGIGVSKARNNGYNAYNPAENSNTRAAANSLGASFKVHESSGKLTAINFAFTYNKIADYNYDISYNSLPTESSLADAFADIANANGLGINSSNKITDQNGYYDYDMNPYFWGTAMAYKAGLINMGSNGGWYPDEIGPGAEMTQYTTLRSRGSAGEFSFALGMNISNILYLGASLDLVSISRKQTIHYSEDISYAGARPDAAAYPYQLQKFRFGQSMQIDGSGVGAKFGLVVRPTKGLRIGFAVHTPSYYSLAYRYEGWLSSDALSVGDNPYGWEVKNGFVYADESTPILKDGGDNRWKFATPTRLLAGISYAFGPYAVISTDYEYDAYRSLKMKGVPTDPGYSDDDFRDNLRGVHTIRAGVEVKPLPWLALRAGGGYKSHIMRGKRDKDGIYNYKYDFLQFDEPVNDTSWYVSTGVGFRLGKVTSIDLAYQYINSRYTDYYSFYTQIGNIPNHSPLYGLDILKHNIALTFAFRF